jgi:hypothetical protein
MVDRFIADRLGWAESVRRDADANHADLSQTYMFIAFNVRFHFPKIEIWMPNSNSPYVAQVEGEFDLDCCVSRPINRRRE